MEDNKNSEVPVDFFSYETGKPFDTCIQCGSDLISGDIPYMVERSIKRYPEMNHTDTIYEYAMCLKCVEKQKESISAESLKNIEQYLGDHLEPDKLFNSYSTGSEESRCAIFGTPLSDMTEYVLQGAFIGNYISPGFRPMIFGERAIMEMAELISTKTRDEMDDFIDTHFSGPPEWRELIRNHKKVLI